MSTKVKITHCAPIIENIYGSWIPTITKEGRDVWIEVETPLEAQIIEAIEWLQTRTYIHVQRLTQIVESNL